EYLKGRGQRETVEYFLKGSPGDFARWPAQTVNYLESHDDSTLLDKLAENEGNAGENPTLGDRRRIHLGIALLLMSVGIPMFAQGMEFLRTKQGKRNTYLDGEANALDFLRQSRFSGTVRYFEEW